MSEPTQESLMKIARECGIGWAEGLGGMSNFLEKFANHFYTIGLEAGVENCALYCESFAKSEPHLARRYEILADDMRKHCLKQS